MSGDARLSLEPIGFFGTPHRDLLEAPRQPAEARGVEGRIELHPGRGFEFALEDLSAWQHLWILFWFHRAKSWRAKVRPPRSRTRRGVFATRSPHRPNPIGLSAVELIGIEGLVLHVRNVDAVDQTPVLDIKPYVAYTDAIADAGDGWLPSAAEPDRGPRFSVEFDRRADEQARFLADRFAIDLAPPIMKTLALGPTPHPYRRIKRDSDGLRLAYKEWRARFHVDGDRVRVRALGTGYRARELALSSDPVLEPHRAFVERFGYPGDQPAIGAVLPGSR